MTNKMEGGSFYKKYFKTLKCVKMLLALVMLAKLLLQCMSTDSENAIQTFKFTLILMWNLGKKNTSI